MKKEDQKEGVVEEYSMMGDEFWRISTAILNWGSLGGFSQYSSTIPLK
ncbi:hypothetical protein [Methanohalophilus portucalensis]|nr:hypothetical protein [Methanohalophilus portucalensis]